MGQLSLWHWLIVLVIVLLFFGPKKLPDLGKSLGKAIRGFKDAMNTEDAEATPVENKKSAQLLDRAPGEGQRAADSSATARTTADAEKKNSGA